MGFKIYWFTQIKDLKCVKSVQIKVQVKVQIFRILCCVYRYVRYKCKLVTQSLMKGSDCFLSADDDHAATQAHPMQTDVPGSQP